MITSFMVDQQVSTYLSVKHVVDDDAVLAAEQASVVPTVVENLEKTEFSFRKATQ
jgi:hypothetical protein